MQRQLSEIEKHGAAAGETGRPHTQDWTIDQGWDRYTAVEHGVWKTLFERQTRLLPGRACDEFVAGMRDLPITADGIPDFRRLSDVLLRRTGWQVVAVPGLVPDEIFFEHTESVFALDDPSPNRIRFELERVMRTHYRIDDFQETYFVLRNLDDLLELAHIDFGPLYDRVRALPDFDPGDVLPTDAVISRGTGRYHRDKRNGQ
jgi:phenylalanine-4-hydroxylase